MLRPLPPPVSRQAVSKWESGASDPSTTNLLALAKLFEISPDPVMGTRVPAPACLAILSKIPRPVRIAERQIRVTDTAAAASSGSRPQEPTRSTASM